MLNFTNLEFRPTPSLLQANLLDLALARQPFRLNQEPFPLLGCCGLPGCLAQF